MKKDYSTILLVFANNLKKTRKDKNLSQEDLADLAGMHRTYIGMLERCEKNITLINLYKISQALNVEIQELLTQHNGDQ